MQHMHILTGTFHLNLGEPDDRWLSFFTSH